MKLPTLMLIACVVGAAMHFHEIAAKLTVAVYGSRWLEDEEQALSKAKAENRFVFLHFTGSDWCGVCKALDREVLSQDEFKAMADENFVLLDIDYPRHKSQSSRLTEQNSNLAKRYQITAVPTIIVLNSNGVVVQKLGYQPGAPEDFLSELKRFRRVGSYP